MQDEIYIIYKNGLKPQQLKALIFYKLYTCDNVVN